MEQSENFDFSPPRFISSLYVKAAFQKPSKLTSCSTWVLPQTVMSSKYKKVPGNLLSYLPTPPLGQDMTQGQFLSGV